MRGEMKCSWGTLDVTILQLRKFEGCSSSTISSADEISWRLKSSLKLRSSLSS